MNLTLVTPQKKILEQAEMKEVLIPAYRGELEILPGHAPLVTTLSAGVLKYKLADSSEFKSMAISWGYCEVTAKGQVTILAETAETPAEIDVKRAEQARAEALEQMGKTDYANFEKYRRKFERAEARIKAVKH